MKRDMDLVRKILMEIESLPLEKLGGTLLEVDGYDQDTISYHIMLLDEAGLLKGIDASGLNDTEWFVDRLTWDGYEFLEAARNQQYWPKAVSTIGKAGGGLVFDVLKQVLVSMIKDAALGMLH